MPASPLPDDITYLVVKIGVFILVLLVWWVSTASPVAKG